MEWGLRDYGIEKQLGLEPTWQEYVSNLVEISREIKRVLRKYGSYYLNLGDTFFGSMQGYGSKGKSPHGFQDVTKGYYAASHQKPPMATMPKDNAVNQPKQKLLIPYRVAIALQEDGWICRNDITWFKPNSMPSSVKDRLTCTTERIFHFVKSRKYYYDLDAIRESHKHPDDVARRIRQDKENGITPFAKDSKTVQWRRDVIPEKYQGKFSGSGESAESFGSPRARTARVNANLEHFREKGSGGHYDFGGLDSSEGKHEHPLGKNPGDTIRTKYADTGLNPESRRMTIQDERDYSRQLSIELYPDDPEAQTQFIHDVHEHGLKGVLSGRNPSDFWEICTRPFPDAHFATFPEELVIKPILSSCPAWVCKKCGKPRDRIVETKSIPTRHIKSSNYKTRDPERHISMTKFLDWTNCSCNADFEHGVVLDPFLGRGTTMKVARDLGRNSIGIEIQQIICQSSKNILK